MKAMYQTARLATLLVVTGLCVLAVMAGTARADGSTSATAYSYSPVSTQVTSVARVKQAAARLNGKLEVAFIMPHGLPKSQQHGCKRGDFAWSDWQTSTGGIVWAPIGHHGLTHACWDGHHWRQVGGPHQWNCGNIVVPMGHLPRGAVKVKLSQIVVVQRFTFTWKLTLRSYISATAAAWAQCTAGGASAAAYAYASGFAYIDVNFTATARTRSTATAKGAHVKLTQSQRQTLRGMARDNAQLNLTTAALATCSGQAPPTPTTPPGVPPPPSPPPVCPPNTNGTPPHCVPGKNGTTGPGTGTPGQPGGTGSGGQPGSGNGPTCRDASGNTVSGTPNADGTCQGVSSSGTTGSAGPAPGSPPPPPAGQCIDPTTNQPVQGTPDQNGYCT